MTTKERLDQLAAKFGEKRRPKIAVLLAEGQTDDQVAATMATDDLAEKDKQSTDLKAALDAANAKVAAAEAKCSELQARLDALSPPNDDEKNKTGAATAGAPKGAAAKAGAQGGAGTGTADQPKNLAQAMVQLQSSGSKLTGIPLRRAALSKFPHLDPDAKTSDAK